MTDLEQRDLGTVDLTAKLTPKRRKIILDSCYSGIYPEKAAAACGVSMNTFNQWMQRGCDALEDIEHVDPSDVPFARLVMAIRTAVAQMEIDALTSIQDHGERSWQATAWLLERTRPDDYGRKYRMEVGNTDGQPFRIDIGGLDGASLEALRDVRKALTRLNEDTSDNIIEGEAVEIEDDD